VTRSASEEECVFAHEEPAFLSLKECRAWEPLAARWGVSVVARGADPSKTGFLEAYAEAKGNPEKLSCFWRRRRQGFCARHYEQIRLRGGELWRDQGLYAGLPTRQALGLVMWAWHPDPAALAESLAVWKQLAASKGWPV
jgi:hypothetical protein